MTQKEIQIIGVPMDLGQSRRGVDMGPSALRYAKLHHNLEQIGRTVIDTGNLSVPVPDTIDAGYTPQRLSVVADVCEQIYQQGIDAFASNRIPLYLGGDHSMSIGSAKAAATQGKIGLIWFDAHGDFNTPESSLSGNIHGMPVAVLTGDGASELVQIGNGITIPAEQIVMIGIRDLDQIERDRLRDSAIKIFTIRHIDEQGIAAVARQALEHLASCDALHISIDMDCLNPDEAPGVGTPVKGGLQYREAQLLMEMLADSQKVCSADIVEINPILDDGNQTAEVAVELITSLLGKTIL